MLEKVKDLKPKQLFLIDAIGAAVSALFLGVILIQLQEYIGLSKEVLYILSIPACFFAIFSFSCYFFLKSNWSKFFKIIASFNSLYALVTLIMMFIHYQEMKILGFVYFIAELIVLLILIKIEFNVSSQSKEK